MLFLNIIVIFYSKTSFINLYLSISIKNYKKFYTVKQQLSMFDYSIIYSKLTGFILLIFFIFTNLIGEFLLSINLNILTMSSSMNIYTNTNFSFNIFTNSNLFSASINNYISYLIYIFVLFSLKYLFILIK